MGIREMLAADVTRECCLSPSTIINAASRAFAVSAVLDEPYGCMAELAVPIVLGVSQPESRSYFPDGSCVLYGHLGGAPALNGYADAAPQWLSRVAPSRVMLRGANPSVIVSIMM